MKGIQRKWQWDLPLAMTLVIFSMLWSANIGCAQDTRHEEGKVKRYEMTGRLQAFNLDEKWAFIGGFKWNLSDNFDDQKFADVLGLNERGTVKFTIKQKTWATYYVILQPSKVSSLNPKDDEMDRKKIKLIVDPNEVKRIYEKGGKIYKIVPCGM